MASLGLLNPWAWFLRLHTLLPLCWLVFICLRPAPSNPQFHPNTPRFSFNKAGIALQLSSLPLSSTPSRVWVTHKSVAAEVRGQAWEAVQTWGWYQTGVWETSLASVAVNPPIVMP